MTHGVKDMSPGVLVRSLDHSGHRRPQEGLASSFLQEERGCDLPRKGQGEWACPWGTGGGMSWELEIWQQTGLERGDTEGTHMVEHYDPGSGWGSR